MAQDSLRNAFNDTAPDRAAQRQASVAGSQGLARGVEQAGQGIAEGIRSQAAMNYRGMMEQLKMQRHQEAMNMKALNYDLEQRELMLEAQKHASQVQLAHEELGVKQMAEQVRAVKLQNDMAELEMRKANTESLIESRRSRTAINRARFQRETLGMIRRNPNSGQYEEAAAGDRGSIQWQTAKNQLEAKKRFLDQQKTKGGRKGEDEFGRLKELASIYRNMSGNIADDEGMKAAAKLREEIKLELERVLGDGEAGGLWDAWGEALGQNAGSQNAGSQKADGQKADGLDADLKMWKKKFPKIPDEQLRAMIRQAKGR